MFSVQIVIGGITSCILGGLMADKFGQKNPLNLSRIAIAGSVLAWPTFLGSVLFTNNLWITIACQNLRYIFGECAWPANISMMQRAGTPE